MKTKRKTFLVLAMLLSGGMASAQVVVKGNIYGGGELGIVTQNSTVKLNGGTAEGSVYGGGEGLRTDENAGLVKGNTTVEMKAGQVKRSIYGGGEQGSVGTFTERYTEVDGAHVVGEPKTCAQNTGKATVKISGGRVGLNNPLMPNTLNPEGDDFGYVFCGSRGEADSTQYEKANILAVVNTTDLEISGDALIAASVYGGCENGMVMNGTHVKIAGGQIGIGYWRTKENGQWVDHFDADGYTTQQWDDAIAAVRSGNANDINSIAAEFHECDAFPFREPYKVFDIFANDYNSQGGAVLGSNGHSFFGNVFGGGSGYYPFAAGQWRRSAGRVWGDIEVEVTGGHILTSLYGGNEYTDVYGKCTVTMSGGTLGVPRTLDSIAAHPVTCYLFGAGMGDSRTLFNTWTNVEEVEVEVSGGTIFGSVFGGGEEGHVHGDVTMTIKDNAHIGTWGYSYVDGNIFGAGRGFSGEALTAGTVGGDVRIDIEDGKILGSVYGGGRLASVGTEFASPTLPNGEPNPHYGHMQEDENNESHGHIIIDISGGTIGNDYESYSHNFKNTKGGNVFGGSMGRLTKLDNTPNEIWPDLAKVKSTSVTVREAEGKKTVIKGNVYGGGELGRVMTNTTVNIQNGTIWRDVYGGGYGSNDSHENGKLEIFSDNSVSKVDVSPLQWAGRVEGNSNVTLSGGWVKKSIYGGGENASVGVVSSDTLGVHKHTDESETFALSWPYEFSYASGNGTATVKIEGGRVGLTGKDYMGPWDELGNPIYYTYDEEGNETMHVYDLTDGEGREALDDACEDNGDVFGGCKGQAGDRYKWAHGANINDSQVTINIPVDEEDPVSPSNYKPTYAEDEVLDFVYAFYESYRDWPTYTKRACIPGAVYGGGENGHVIGSTNITLTQGLVGHNVYGGGKGSDKYTTRLKKVDPVTQEPLLDEQGQFIYYDAKITSISAGRVYGNTNITMNDGYVLRNIYGGGNKASVGKGNYAGGPGDYQEAGYGERWSSTNATELQAVLANSGHTYITVKGGTVGTEKGMKDDIPTGNVFGSSRGEAAPNVRQTLSPRIHYYPQFFLGYVNHTHVTIGDNDANTTPRLYGSVYGGGQDGHVRWETNVIVNKGEIGNAYVSEEAAQALVGTSDKTHYQWMGRGNVLGAGAGVGKFKGTDNLEHYSTSAGSVTQFSNVTINGGTIHNCVYGGGPLASVGPPRMALQYDASREQTLAKVTINGTIGVESDVKNCEYGGNVFGASRGIYNSTDNLLDYNTHGTVIYTEVNLLENAFVPGYVFGGGDLAMVKQDTKVNMEGGRVGTIAYNSSTNTIVHTSGGSVYGGGKGKLGTPTVTNPTPAQIVEAIQKDRDAGLVKGNTEVIIGGGQVYYNVYGGGDVASVGLRKPIYTDENNTTIKDYEPDGEKGVAKVTINGGQVGPTPKTEEGHVYTVNDDDGCVFGGGKGIGDDPIYGFNPTVYHYSGKYYEIADVNSTLVTVNMDMPEGDDNTNRIWGSVFGGAEDGHVLGNTEVRYQNGLTGVKGLTGADGNLFGGGRNIGKKNYNAGRVRGNITVTMSGGQLYGSIFGGGRLALTGIDLFGNIIPDEEGTNGAKFGKTLVQVKGGTVGNKEFMKTHTSSSMGDVFGGGKGDMEGIEGHPKASALLISLTKNTTVEISEEDPENHPTLIYGTVYGGGEVANVGHYLWDNFFVDNDPTQPEIKNISLKPGTGITNVTVTGGRIGVDRMEMDATLVGGNGPDKYNLKYNTDLGHVFGGGEGIVGNPALSHEIYENGENDPTTPLLNLMATVGETHVTIGGTAWVKGSVYGGSAMGHVRGNTNVTIEGGQIGAGNNTDENKDELYAHTKFFNPVEYFHNDAHSDVESTKALYECAHWYYDESNYHPFDPIEVAQGRLPKDGGSWFGNVFGGGSGFYPYIVQDDDNNDVAQWNPAAGKVWGNTRVEITGGHILTSVYGGCETTDVEGSSTVIMRNGTSTSAGQTTVTVPTLGVPRTFQQIKDHPVTCYLFGAGKGNPETYFNEWTNVASATVQVSGGIIYGSIFGGGEEGHVFGDADVTVSEGTTFTVGSGNNTTTYHYPVIGTTGRSYVDGNVFGGGRGFSGNAYTAGVVRGDVTIGISGGMMLGSVYGGGRLASVGTYLVPPTNSNYGLMMPDVAADPEHNVEAESHGHIIINVSGGIIGNDYEAIYHTDFKDHPTGGNVFTGGMGRLTKLNGDVNNMWPNLAMTKSTTLTVSGTAEIKGNVYGGGEFGTVAESSIVNIEGGTIWRDVFGGGFGSHDVTSTGTYRYLDANNTTQVTTVTPMEWSGLVEQNATISISGGWVKKCVYGGGELASVGTITEAIEHGSSHPFNFSWPYEFKYKNGTGTATISVTGGRVGITGKDFMGPYAWINGVLKPVKYNAQGEPTALTDTEIKDAEEDNGDLYGGCRGEAGDGHAVAKLANVNETVIEINYDYTNVPVAQQATPQNYAVEPINPLVGCVAGAVYGGAQDGHVNTDANITLTNGLVGHAVYGSGKGKGKYKPAGSDEKVYSHTSGKVYGDTHVNIEGGYVVRSVFGGGNLASVGKGNFLGLENGETTDDEELLELAANSGRTYVNIYGGQLGMLNKLKPGDVFKDTIPYGSVFGGCRGKALASTDVADHRFGFVNNTYVTIGENVGNTNNPRLYGSVYGGAQDGHVRRKTHVIVNNGEIGVAYVSEENASNTVGNADLTTMHWTDRGNVYGGGSGLGLLNENDDPAVSTSYAPMAGTVFETTEVEIKGGTIHRAVYGGGNLASVLGDGDNNDKVKVTISQNAIVGDQRDINKTFAYGGNVFGAGKGFASNDFEKFCNVINTDVTIQGGNVYGDVYGGGENGHVLNDTDVKITTYTDSQNSENNTVASVGLLEDQNGGTTSYDGNVFGGGFGSGHTNDVDEFEIYAHCGRVGGNTNVTMDGGAIQGTIYGGGRLALVGVDERGNPYVTENDYDSVKVVNNTNVFHGLTTITVSGTATEGEGGNTTYSTSIGNTNWDKLLNGNDESVGDIFGSGKGDVKNYEDVLAGRVANTKISINGSPRIHGTVFGGGEMASIGYWHLVNGKQVFYENCGTSVVTIGRLDEHGVPVGDNPVIGTYGELSSAYAGTQHNWTFYDEDGKITHTCTGNVYGGGQGDVDPESPHWVSMSRSKNTYVTINGGTIMSEVYGGAEQGSIAGDARVTINGGTIGTPVNAGTTNEYLYGGVYGGGFGSNISEYNGSTYEDSPITNDSISLGGELWHADHMAGRTYGNTRVDLLGGTVRGDVYAGANYAYTGGYGNSIKGNVALNIGSRTAGATLAEDTFSGDATILGNVYGANNHDGTPYGNVDVNIYQTHHKDGWATPGNTAPTTPEGGWTADALRENAQTQGYAINQVFGGGNHADYLPEMPPAGRGSSNTKRSLVHVWNCGNTIRELFGGSNASDIGSSQTNADANLIVDGGRFHRIFGGGNGESATLAADINGWANTTINGGVIDTVFGGGNSYGSILHTDLVFTHQSPMNCDEFILDIFGGSNNASNEGELITTLLCEEQPTFYENFYGGSNHGVITGNVTLNAYGGHVQNLFGGSKGDFASLATQEDPNHTDIQADIKDYPVGHALHGTGGNVTLNLYGGTYENVFGGSDLNGNIEGVIKVNVLDKENETCPLYITNIYGASSQTSYLPNDIIVEGEPQEGVKPVSPIINVVHIKSNVKGDVYGGAYGADATVTSNPQVNIGYDATSMSQYIPTEYQSVLQGILENPNKELCSDVEGDVYGGGELASLVGSPVVNINEGNVGFSGNDAENQGRVFGGGKGDKENNEIAKVTGDTHVNIKGGQVFSHVYGGGDVSIIDGNANVILTGGEVGAMKQQMNGGQPVMHQDFGIPMYDLQGGKVFGGGCGYIAINDVYRNCGLVKGNTYVTVSGSAKVYDCVYGGGQFASVGEGRLNDKFSGVATVTINGGEIGPLDGSGLNAYIYGGGMGVGDDYNNEFKSYSNVDSTSVIVSGSARIYGSIFGGSADGHVLGGVKVLVEKGTGTSIPVVGTNGKTSWDGNIFGGGRNFYTSNLAAGRVGGNIRIDMTDGQLYGSIFGGGRMGLTGVDMDGMMIRDEGKKTFGWVTINVSGGTVGNLEINDTWKYSVGDVFGGGKGTSEASSDPFEFGRVKNTEVTISDNAKVLGSVYGGGELANVGWIEEDAYVSNTGHAVVNIDGGTIGREKADQSEAKFGNVFGGSKGLPGLDYIDYANVNNTEVYITKGDILGAVFGGSDDGHVWGDTKIDMSGGTVGKKNTLVEFLTNQLDQPAKGHIYSGSVLGGGRGIHTDNHDKYSHVTGIVKGNTEVTISDGTVRHGVYGGGGLSSVGTFRYDETTNEIMGFVDKTGTTTVNVLGGLIGPTKEDLTEPTGDDLTEAKDYYVSQHLLDEGESFTEEQYIDTVFKYIGGNAGWVFGAGCGLAGDDYKYLTFNNNSVVEISKEAQVVGAVYGGGENGHVFTDAELTVSGGTIGAFPLHGKGTVKIEGGPYDGKKFNSDINELEEDEYGAGRRVFRGEVYGGGKGTDMYEDADHNMVYSMTAGRVFGNTTVNISGGTIYNRVFGGGSLASVGKFTYYKDGVPSNIVSSNLGDALQRITYVEKTGLAKVNVTGGTIGSDGNNNGDVVGGGRGLVGDPGNVNTAFTAPDDADQVTRLAYVASTEVNISEKAGVTTIMSNVYGGSINGHVYGDTKVTVSGGTIGYTYNENGKTKVHGEWHSNVYGGGGGSGRYMKTVTHQGSSTTVPHLSITSGRVYGNTEVNIEGGTIMHNVYGGGAIASVGNYNLRIDSNDPLIDGTGIAQVTVTNGTIGYDGDENGMVFGSGRGHIVNPNVNPENYSDSLSYVGRSFVNIGTETSAGTPIVKGSVYGSGENGHVFEATEVNIWKGTIGCATYEPDNFDFRGNVYGGGCGTDTYKVNNVEYYNPTSGQVWGTTEVNIYGGTISRNVYGGGAMATVGTIETDGSGNFTGLTVGTGQAVVNVMGGTIGTLLGTNVYGGDVYGGSRGPSGENENGFDDKALVEKAFVNVMDRYSGTTLLSSPTIRGSVFGGGTKSVVRACRVVNINGGTVEQDVFGGSNSPIVPGTPFASLKTVNVRGGHIKGNVYGCSSNADEGAEDATSNDYTGFVNISGGTIGTTNGNGNVFAAGEGGLVNGSLRVNIGKEAILQSLTGGANPYYNDLGYETTSDPTPTKLIINGNVYGGSDYYGTNTTANWNQYDVTGYSMIYVDGTDYDTESSTENDTYMNLEGGIYGSGAHCESGATGRGVIIRNYGGRNLGDELTQASRSLTTIQRGGIVLLENANLNLTGAYDISNSDLPLPQGVSNRREYGVLKADEGLYAFEGSGIVLGAENNPAFMDEIKEVKSLYLKGDNPSAYTLTEGNWYVAGINESDNHLYRIEKFNTNSPSVFGNALTPAEENVIIFNDTSKMWVRYHDVNANNALTYGELQGFFRMRSSYNPYGTETFAYARPKLTVKNVSGLTEADELNERDGGFLSYDPINNFYTRISDGFIAEGDDGGDPFTFTKQYPYTNMTEITKDGNYEYREWVLHRVMGRQWYVDGRDLTIGGVAGIGVDDKANGRGLYPDMPKKTITRNDATQELYGIYAGTKDWSGSDINFVQDKDAIYVVGPVNGNLDLGLLNLNQDTPLKPLKLYRYPGGHTLSPTPGATDPGANYGALVETFDNSSIGGLTLNNVEVDGLYGHENFDGLGYPIDANFDATRVTEPLVVTHTNSKLTLNGGTVLKRGYNSRDASNWYTNPDYTAADGVHDGGALYVNEEATVNVEGMVTITGNQQKKGDGYVESNVYLPTFATKLVMSDEMRNYDDDEHDVHEHAQIGVTSPKRNVESEYELNTLSPVAIAAKSGAAPNVNTAIAVNAWDYNNFTDDQNWFFGNNGKSTYHSNVADATYMQPQGVYFGWTWANVVRTMPSGFAYDNLNSAEDLAWLISLSTGMNGVETPTDFSGQSLKQTDDIDLLQYVWVPIGKEGDGFQPFAGNFDGQGHLIKNLSIRFTGNKDYRYERKNYGLFGYVKGGTINRTFVVSGEIEPEISVAEDINIGGLVGCLANGTTTNGKVSNSEAAVTIISPDIAGSGIVAGGLVAKLESGEIHSSMAMPWMKVGEHTSGSVGGLVGSAIGGNIYNSFVNGQFTIDGQNASVQAAGLLGNNGGATMKNCYVALYNGSVSDGDRFRGIANQNSSGTIDNCYVMPGFGTTNGGTNSSAYTSTITADELGYMYSDNTVTTGTTTTPLFKKLNEWVDSNNGVGHTYARWARPGLGNKLNGDLPVLLLEEYDVLDEHDKPIAHQGSFRSVGTYAGGPALQYGGPVRDGEADPENSILANELDGALVRENADNTKPDYLFVYGDVTEAPTSLVANFTQEKVSIYEDASVIPGTLAGFANTYVGITFDNSSDGNATWTTGVNYGLGGLGGSLLPRDWHMFSSPLSNAPIGFNYGTDNTIDGPSNNPWTSTLSEFHWLNQPGSNECAANAGNRYWLYAFDDAVQTTDGYFPTRRGALFSKPSNPSAPLESEINNLFIEGSNEYPSAGMNRYPYGMDFLTWYEPEYHWINFKRNGPNHWHSDGDHEQISYKPAEMEPYQYDQNENQLIPGRGYMASITKETLMQSHGTLNVGAKTIPMTSTLASKLPGWNLVGNPYHGYLDFHKLVEGNPNAFETIEVEGQSQSVPFYVVYDADSYSGFAESAFLCYPATGSIGGAYAGQYLHPHQGFYVKLKPDPENPNQVQQVVDLNFNEGMIATRSVLGTDSDTDGHFRGDHGRPSYPLVNLFLSSDKGCSDVTVIEFERPEWGGARKLKELRVGDGLFYGHHDGTYYAALFAQSGVDRVPVWFEAKDDDIFTMKWKLANADFQSMYLIDNIAGVQYDMLRNDTYAFEGHVGDYPSRFYIVFRLTDVEEFDDDTDHNFAFFNGSEWVVTGDGDLEFIDVHGQILAKSHISGQSRVILPLVADGPYLFRLTNSNETRIQKVIITK